jgi:hypothetical protein
VVRLVCLIIALAAMSMTLTSCASDVLAKAESIACPIDVKTGSVGDPILPGSEPRGR